MDKIRISAVGDIMLGDQPVSFGFGVRSQYERRGYSALIQSDRVARVFTGSDLVVGNFESSVDHDHLMAFETHTVSATGSAASFLSDLGVNILSLANNHVLEHGERGLEGVQRVLTENRIRFVGTSDSPRLDIPIKGRTITFLSYSAIPDFKNTSRICLWDDEMSPRLIQEAATSSDLTIVLIHWGNEFMRIPSPRQKKLGKIMIDAGADLVLGSHPHVLQPVERYQSGLIAYSMGNFIFDNYYRPASHVAMFQFEYDASAGTFDLVTIPLQASLSNYSLHDSTDSEEVMQTEYREDCDCALERDYNRHVFFQRMHYRAMTAIHMASNLHRYPSLLSLARFAGKRLFLFLGNIRREIRSPETVYR